MWRGTVVLPERGHGHDRHSIVCERAASPAPSSRRLGLRAWRPQTIGIILNGATGRIGSTQHLAERTGPDPRRRRPCRRRRSRPAAPAAGRPRRRASRGGRAHRTASRTGPPISTPRSPIRPSRVFFDAAATQQRAAVLDKAIAAGKHIYSEKPVAPTVAEGLALLQRGAKRAGSSTARSRTRSIFPDCRSSPQLTQRRRRSAASSASGSNSAGGCSTASSTPCQRPSWNYRAGGGGLILDMYPHWRYVIETIIGRIARVASATWTATPERIDEQGERYAVDVEDTATTLVELEGGAFGTILSSWATRVRRDDLLTLQVDGTKGSARRRPASLPRAVGGADAGDRTFQRHEGHRRRLSRRLDRRAAARRPIAIPTGSAGSTSCATSRPMRRWQSNFAAGIRDVAFAEACHRSMAERTWIAFPPRGRCHERRSRTALVTGASTGIGRAIALALAPRGLRPRHHRSRYQLARGRCGRAALRGRKVVPIALELRSEDSIAQAVEQAADGARRDRSARQQCRPCRCRSRPPT